MAASSVTSSSTPRQPISSPTASRRVAVAVGNDHGPGTLGHPAPGDGRADAAAAPVMIATRSLISIRPASAGESVGQPQAPLPSTSATSSSSSPSTSVSTS